MLNWGSARPKASLKVTSSKCSSRPGTQVCPTPKAEKPQGPTAPLSHLCATIWHPETQCCPQVGLWSRKRRPVIPPNTTCTTVTISAMPQGTVYQGHKDQTWDPISAAYQLCGVICKLYGAVSVLAIGLSVPICSMGMPSALQKLLQPRDSWLNNSKPERCCVWQTLEPNALGS